MHQFFRHCDDMKKRFDLAELEALYASLLPEERDQLLQSSLIAASIGGGTVIQRLEERLLVLSGETLIDEVSRGEP